MLKDISFGKAITIIGLILLLCGYAEKKSKKVDVATIPESNVIIVEGK